MHPNDSNLRPASPSWLRSLGDLLWVIYLSALAVAGFAFTVSYTHIYDLGAAHAQYGVADVMLPLSVDLLIVVASLVLFRQSREAQQPEGLARWLPRIVLWSGIAATVAANVAYGMPHGWLSAVISGWPGAAFVMVVETVMIAVRPGTQTGRQDEGAAVVFAGSGRVPSNSHEAAELAYAESVKGKNPLGPYQLHTRFGIPKSAADKIVKGAAPERGRGREAALLVPAASPNGSGAPHG